MDLTVYGPKSGVHSGNYGNWIPNPAWRLVHLLASMKDADGRVLVDGFYDGIAPLDARRGKDASETSRTTPSGCSACSASSAPEAPGRSLQEAFQTPTLNIRGLASAHVGAGARTIIPDRATAAIDVRLVKETRADAMLEKIRAHIRRQGYLLVDDDPDDEVRAKQSKIARLTGARWHERVSHVAADDPQVSALASRARAHVWRAAGADPHARWHRPDRAVHRGARLPGRARADRQLRQQPARGEREPETWNLFEGIVTIAALLTM